MRLSRTESRNKAWVYKEDIFLQVVNGRKRFHSGLKGTEFQQQNQE